MLRQIGISWWHWFFASVDKANRDELQESNQNFKYVLIACCCVTEVWP